MRKPLHRLQQPVVALFLLFALGPAAVLADGECDQQAIVDFTGTGIGGTGQLCDTPVGLKAQLRAHGLSPGEAYTVWWIYIDDPSQCVPDNEAPPGFECDYSFFFNDGDPLAVIGRFDSGIAPDSGMLHFKDNVLGLHASSGSQTWLLIMAHGDAATGDGRALARQLLTPEDPIFGVPHLGNLVDGTLAYPAASSFHMKP